MTDLHSLKLKDGALKFLYSLLPPIVRDYRLSFYFDTATVQPCKSIANDNVDFGLRLVYNPVLDSFHFSISGKYTITFYQDLSKDFKKMLRFHKSTLLNPIHLEMLGKSKY